jgi:hypothetical protein
LILHAPTPCNDDIHDKLIRLSGFGIIDHFIELQVSVPFDAQSPPEALTKTSVKE